MKKKYLASLILFFCLIGSKVYSADFEIKARTAILQDYLSGKILYEKNADLKNVHFLWSMSYIKFTLYFCARNRLVYFAIDWFKN